MRILLLVNLGLITPSLILAQGSMYRSGDLIRVASTDTVSSQLFSAGERIEIAGHVRNDIYLAGQYISLNGSFGDDAFLFGEILILNGTVGDMMAGAGKTISIDGTVGGDVIMAGKEIYISENAKISGNVLLAAEQIHYSGGTVNGWMRLAARSVHLNGKIDSYAVIHSSDVTFGSSYAAPGGTKIISNTPIYRENLGSIPANLEIEIRKPRIWPGVLFNVWFYLSLLVTGLVLLFLFQPAAVDMQRFAVGRFWQNTGVGLLAFLGIPLLTILLIIPLLTIPLAVITGILYVFSLFLSYLLVALILGIQVISWINKKPGTSTYYWAMALGLILIALLANAPFIGVILNLLLIFFGLGSVIAFAWYRYRSKTT